MYCRYFDTYDKQIENYLKKNGLQQIKIESPKKEDWANSPFKSPKKIEISLVQIRVLGMPVDYSSKKYKLILAKSADGKTRRVWMEVESNLFSKPKFKFSVE